MLQQVVEYMRRSQISLGTEQATDNQGSNQALADLIAGLANVGGGSSAPTVPAPDQVPKFDSSQSQAMLNL